MISGDSRKLRDTWQLAGLKLSTRNVGGLGLGLGFWETCAIRLDS